MPGDAGTDAAVADLARAGRPRVRLPLSRRERVVELAVGGSLVGVAVAMAVFLEAERAFEWGPALGLVAAFALAARVKIDVGAGYTVPTQLVFVPMLLLAPTTFAPLLVLAGWLAAGLPDALRGRTHPERLLLAAANSWYAVGPALVLVALGAQDPALGHWPAYVAALATQFGFDSASQQLRERAGRNLPIPFDLLGGVYAIDALLSPVGLLAAIASRHSSVYAFLLLAPAVALFVVFARERAQRLADAMALSDREREASELARRVLEAEREATRGREDMLAGASSEVLTPLAALSGLVSRLRATAPADEERRRAVEAAMLREAHQIRHVVGQFLDYARLRAGRELVVEPRPTELAPVLGQVVAAFPAEDRVRIDAPDELPAVWADPGRLSQMLVSLVSNGVKFARPGAGVTITAALAGDRMELCVADHGPGIPEAERSRMFGELERGENAGDADGVGLGLYLCRVLADAQGARIAVESSPEEGSRFTIVLPLAAGAGRERRALRRLRSLR
jgi:signal transduction histidine kinase